MVSASATRQRGDVRRDAAGRDDAPLSPAGHVPATVRTARPAHPAPGREGLRRAATGVAGPPARPRRGPRAGRDDGARDASFLRARVERISDVSIRQLLGELAATEREHYARATTLEKELLTPETRQTEDEAARQLFVLQIVQPGLAGLMDGSVSTLAPLFAAAFATHSSHDAFLVGLAASVGAGISMGFAEALSDDGSLTGRGHPWVRGIVCGLMTTAGGLGHTLPFLVPNFALAMTFATIVVIVGAWPHQLDSPPLHGHADPVRHVPGCRRRCSGVSGWTAHRERINELQARVFGLLACSSRAPTLKLAPPDSFTNTNTNPQPDTNRVPSNICWTRNTSKVLGMICRSVRY